MTLDGLTMHNIVEEISDTVVGCKIDKVHQPRPDTIILALRAPGKNVRLLLCAGAGDSRIHLTDQKYLNPKAPPMFCMFLRKHLTGARIAAAEQVGLERIMNLKLESKDELGIPRTLTLICELMGKYSNLILINDNGIIQDSLRHVTQSLSRVRCILPSLTYELPQSTKLNPITISRPTLVELLEKRAGRKPKVYLSQILQGISGPTADEILYRYMPLGYAEQPREAEKLADAILAFFAAYQHPSPTMYSGRDGIPFFFSPMPYDSVHADNTASFETMNALVDCFYGRLNEIGLLDKKRRFLASRVAKQLDKLSNVLSKQLETISRAEKAEKYKVAGDIITANIYRISRGMRTLDAQDYATGQPITVALDARLSPAANAQKNYKRYNKLKAGLDITAKRMRNIKGDIAFLESVQVSLDACDTTDELLEIEYELIKAGIIHTTAVMPKATQQPSKPLRFTSSDGYTILAGKNNRQNDVLTMKTAAPDDIWLHTKDIPGAHVLIVGAGGRVPDTTLLEAATIAATLSKAKNSLKVAVDYAPRKNVRKPAGAKPGMVVYEGYHTLLADPSQALYDRLLMRQHVQI